MASEVVVVRPVRWSLSGKTRLALAGVPPSGHVLHPVGWLPFGLPDLEIRAEVETVVGALCGAVVLF